MALCITRDAEEAVVLLTSDGLIRILVKHSNSGDLCRLVMDAPACVPIWREELYQQKLREGSELTHDVGGEG